MTTTVDALLTRFGASTREGPRPPRDPHSAFVGLLWLSALATDADRCPIDRACATEIISAYTNKQPLSTAASEWASELIAHRGRWYHTHPWGPGHRAAIVAIVGELLR